MRIYSNHFYFNVWSMNKVSPPLSLRHSQSISHIFSLIEKGRKSGPHLAREGKSVIEMYCVARKKPPVRKQRLSRYLRQVRLVRGRRTDQCLVDWKG